jgi:hypothetical protein
MASRIRVSAARRGAVREWQCELFIEYFNRLRLQHVYKRYVSELYACSPSAFLFPPDAFC